MGPPIHFQTKFLFSYLYFFLFLRYIGSMVADVHRTLKYGGIFMYPATGFLFNLQNFNIPIFALPSIEPKWQTASALRVHAHGLHHRTGGGHCQHWTVSSNTILFQLTKGHVTHICLTQEANSGHHSQETSRKKPDLPRQPRRCQRRTRAHQEEPRSMNFGGSRICLSLI